MATDTDTLTLTCETTWAWEFAKSLAAGGAQSVRDARRITLKSALTEGTGSGQANQLWVDRRYVSSVSANDDIDLSGALVNTFGDAAQFSKVKGIIIVNRATASGDRLVVGGGSNPVTDWFNGVSASRLVVGPGPAPFILGDFVAGFTISAGTADTLRIAYGGSSGYITYDIGIVGLKA